MRWLTLCLALLTTPAAAERAIWINADDISPATIKGFKNIEKLADMGMTLDEFYATANQCQPSRIGAMTGVSQQRYGSYKNPPEGTLFGKGSHRDGAPGDARTVAEMAGSVPTAIIGKWHLGVRPEQLPTRQGFDYAAVILGGGHAYDPNTGPIWVNGKSVKVSKNMTDYLADQAVEWIGKHDDYLLVLTPTAPHEPFQATAEQMKNCKGNKFCGVMTGLDTMIGRVIAALEKKNQLRGTLIWFTGDNGCGAGTPCSNGGLRGHKGQAVGEGGVRVPGIVVHQGHIKPGSRYAWPVTSLDIVPTILDFLGKPTPVNLEGVSMLSRFADNKPASDRSFYWAQTPKRGSIRKGKWKYYLEGKTPLLFDLDRDPRELNNVAAQNEDAVTELRSDLVEWLNKMPAPAF